MKVVCGLGNPGPEYASTRHNVGWWVVERAAAAWEFPSFRRDGRAQLASGSVRGRAVRLVKPLTYMNRSGGALPPLLRPEGLDVSRDLLVVVDDAALEVGRVRFRARGSAGGHNGLKSVEAVLRTRDYARLRVGVGEPPPGIELSDWVLSPFPPEDRDRIVALLPDLVDAVETWLEDGVETAMNRHNR